MKSVQSGLTLFDILISVSIVAVTASMSAPAMSDFLAKMRSSSASSLIHRQLAVARNLAVSRSQNISICGLDSDGACTREGFREMAIFQDRNRNDAIDDDEPIFSRITISRSHYSVLRASWRRPYIEFTHEGFAKQAGSFYYCEPHYRHHARRVTVSMAGRTYTGRDTNGDGIVEMTNGEPIQC